ncbi:MAG: TetR/AcrR family transcriptional regulator [Gammaproteobacteria bacterium]|nr:TetR/AcrR family transcriptional regulator [Gammaproteobacteria bacterium]MDH5801665.1 TetR/AcrR family transcriptional regulator [Gammaproteobacteria bacterium]
MDENLTFAQTTVNPPKGDETKLKILDAARERFQSYGYNKTTMAEIAKDCDMSAANLYRHFENKLDIGARLACDCLSNKVRILSDVLQTDLSASEKLRRFVLETLRETNCQISETPRINEMVTAICDSKMDLVYAHMEAKQNLLMQLIAEGNRKGEFQVENTQQAAQSILVAITVFDVPTFMHLYTLESLQHKAHSLVDLLIDGLKSR